MKIQVTIDVYPECADPGHNTGLTEDAYMDLMGAVGEVVGDIDMIEKVAE